MADSIGRQYGVLIGIAILGAILGALAGVPGTSSPCCELPSHTDAARQYRRSTASAGATAGGTSVVSR